MERELRTQLRRDDVAVLNAGTVSYSPLLAQRLFDGIVVNYRPTLVLFVLDATDIGDDYNYEKELVADGAGGRFDWTGLEVSPYYGAVGEVVRLGKVLKVLGRPVAKLQSLVGLKPIPTYEYDWYQFRAELGGRIETNRFFIYRHPLEETRPFFDRTYGYVEALARSAERAGAAFALIVTPRYHHWNPKECPENWEADEYAVAEPYQYEYFRYFEERRAGAPFEIYDLLPALRATGEFPLVLRRDPPGRAAGCVFFPIERGIIRGFPGPDALGPESFAAEQPSHPFVGDRRQEAPPPAVCGQLGHRPGRERQAPLGGTGQRDVDQLANLGPGDDGPPPLRIGRQLERREPARVEAVHPFVHHGHVAAHAIGNLGDRPASGDLGDQPIPPVQPDRQAPILDLGLQHPPFPPRQRPEPYGVGHAVPPQGQGRRENAGSWPN